MLRERMENAEIARAEQVTSVPAVLTTYTVPVPAAGDPVGLTGLTGSIWRRKATITAAAMAGLMAGLVVSGLTPPTFRARTSMQLEGFNDEQFLRSITPISPQMPNATPENYLQNQVKVIESETLAKRVADKVGAQPESKPRGAARDLIARLRNQFSFSRSWPSTPEKQRIETVQKALTVRTSLQSQVIELFYDAGDPKTAALAANAAASEFI